MNHLPEPWRTEECGAGEFFIMEDDGIRDDGWGKHIGEVEGKANADRIVACVNACKGIDNDTLNLLRNGMLASIIGNLIAAKPVTADALGAFLRDIRQRDDGTLARM